MFRQLSVLLLAFGLAVASLAPSAVAHHPDPTTGVGTAGPQDFNLSGGVFLPFQEGHSFSVLVGLEYRGVRAETADHHSSYRYFWVSGMAHVTPAAAGHAPEGGGEHHHSGSQQLMDSLILNIVPVTKITTSHEGWVQAWRFGPIEASRDISLGINSSVKVQAIGLSHYAESELAGEQLKKFAQIAVDVIGFRYANVVDRGDFVGAQAGSLVGQVGAIFSHGPTTVRLSLGTRAGVAVGGFTSQSRAAVLGQADFFGRVEALFDNAYGRLGVFLEGGHHTFRIYGGDADNPTGHGHPFLMMGVSWGF